MIQWQKSSFSSGSDGAACVELAAADGALLLRESEDPERVLTLEPAALGALLHHLKAPGRLTR
ncbi:DUF397 domain-containing protein [Streptomyces flavofungini]|uniref:DUF397 domain-containing protein n=1 Tax=Streptomyces flavofungini TaxID=68200 RepID=A0ABS0WY03_9ACTN|nr:DUF397 domain-containing protein [Streptomyces flavofungini]MBJ3805812.1 DUF397 domain-containing protein [Streptomyces flavofungini]GHC75474.1 hypothetical protein GCM10010349_54570 [Streptomyces flavofungini]